MTARHDYERFLCARHRPAHGRRTAEQWAGFFLPHLHPGMRLLDLGCGPGSITAGLARDLTAVGVDMSPVAIESVPVAAADAAALPFPDARFDAVFSNALLQHVADPLAVLREARRVARPGAVIGVGDADWGGALVHPADPAIDRGLAIRAALRPGGHEVRVGRELRGLLSQAGFERAEASVTGAADGTADAVGRVAAFESSWFRSPEVVAYVAEQGIADPGEMDAIAAAWDRWGQDPGAFAARFWVTALAWAPGDASQRDASARPAPAAASPRTTPAAELANASSVEPSSSRRTVS